MPILRKLKSLLGVGDGEDDAERDVTVTVEHDPENEAAVKGADVGDDATAAPESESESGAARGSDASEATDTTQEPDGTGDDVEIPDAEERTTGSADAASDEPETETDETESEEEVDAADATDGEPVDVLDGIGPAYAQRLGDAGVDTVAELADADAAELSDATEIAEGRIQNWIDQAAEY